MGWDTQQKKVIRSNAANQTGDDVWQQDMQAKVKIIAQRHDYHDQDLADAISECLHTGGLNAMKANLDMGGFNIVNIGPGTVFGLKADDINTMVFDNPTRTLTLTRYGGGTLTAVIPDETGGGGGSGTVTSIAAGAGIVCSPNPIVGAGTISLAVVGVGATYTGGITGITVDNYGRVTQVQTGAQAGTNLGIGTKTTETVQITSSTGNAATIPAATTSVAGLMTKSDKVKLDGIVDGANKYVHPNHSGEVTSAADGAQTLQAAAIGNRSSITAAGLAAADEFLVKDSTVLKRLALSELLAYMQENLNMGSLVPPKVLHASEEIINFDPQGTGTVLQRFEQAGMKVITTTTATLIDITGSGVVEFLALISDVGGNNYVTGQVVIDGTVVWSASTGLTQLNNFKGFCPIGSVSFDATGEIDAVAFQQIAFNSSLRVTLGIATGDRHAAIKYYTT